VYIFIILSDLKKRHMHTLTQWYFLKISFAVSVTHDWVMVSYTSVKYTMLDALCCEIFFFEPDLDECATFNSRGLLCRNGATCTNEIGSFKCNCSDGWTGRICSEGMYSVSLYQF
jgi:hypothetical protein